MSLASCALAVLAGLLGVGQALLDRLAAGLQHAADPAKCHDVQDREEDQEAEGLGDDPEEVDLESSGLAPGLGSGEHGQAVARDVAGDGEEVHGQVVPVVPLSPPPRRPGRSPGCRRRPRGRRGLPRTRRR
jgi:hypothetical protein